MSIPLSQLGELINVGRGVNCQAIISLQSVAQLYDTYGENRGHALLSDMTTSIILRCADAESVEFARATIGTHFEEYTAHTERESIPGGGSITTARETRLHEEHDFTIGDFYQFNWVKLRSLARMHAGFTALFAYLTSKSVDTTKVSIAGAEAV